MYVWFEEFTVVGDLEGRFDPLEKLMRQCPTEVLISVGDAHDRGTQNKEVLELFLDNPNFLMTQSNHTHMLTDFCDGSPIYDGGTWVGHNGGSLTLQSFGITRDEIRPMLEAHYEAIHSIMPHRKEEFIKRREELAFKFKEKLGDRMYGYLKNLPFYIEGKDFVITHAPINPTLPLEEGFSSNMNKMTRLGGLHTRDLKFLWNTGGTRRRDKFQIHGHMSHREAKWLTDRDGVYGINVDSSVSAMTMMHWPSRELFVEELGLSYD